jgi:hypothetical protein
LARSLSFLAIVTLGILSSAACGGDDDDSGTDTATVTPGETAEATATEAATATGEGTPTPTLPPPADVAAMPPAACNIEAGETCPASPGRYYTSLFKPRFTFTLGDGWSKNGESSLGFLLIKRPEPGDIALAFDSRTGTQTVEERAAALMRTQGVEFTAEEEATVAGFSATRFEATVSADSVSVPQMSEGYTIRKGDHLRFYVVDVAGTTVTMIIEAPDTDFEGFQAEAEEVLAGLVFE